MNTENTVDKIEETQNPIEGNNPNTIDLSQMTREELEAYAVKNAKAFKDQEGLNKKLKSKLDAPATPAPATTDTPQIPAAPATPVVPEVVIDPVKKETPTTSLDEQYEIAQLSTKFSLEELKEAKSLVGTSFGTTLVEVSKNPGFLAHINAKRDVNKSDTMMSDDPIHIQTFQSNDQFVKDVEAGVIDLEADPESRAKYVKILAEAEAERV